MLGGCRHLSNNTFPALTSRYYKGRRPHWANWQRRMVFTQLLLYSCYKLLPVNTVTITAAITTHPLLCRSSNHTTVTALQASLFLFQEPCCDVAFGPSSHVCMSNLWQPGEKTIPSSRSIEVISLSLQIAGWSSSGKGLSSPTGQQNRRVVQLWHHISKCTLHSCHIWWGE